MTIAEQWKMEGRREGHMEGRREGHVEGRREGHMEGILAGRNAIVTRLITKRFGQDIWTVRLEQRLQNATLEDLDLWAERILDAKRIEDVFENN